MVFKFFIILVVAQYGCFAMPEPDMNVKLAVNINGMENGGGGAPGGPNITGLFKAMSSCSEGSCDCHLIGFKGCVISCHAPDNKACCCSNEGFHCKGQVVDCEDAQNQHCIKPDNSLDSCRQAAGCNCHGYF